MTVIMGNNTHILFTKHGYNTQVNHRPMESGGL
jgi:hypothetical protein